MRRYLAAALLVRLADEGARVALVLLALERTDSATAGGLAGLPSPIQLIFVGSVPLLAGILGALTLVITFARGRPA